MINFYKQATNETPYVRLNEQTGIMEISGRSVPQETEEFWAPVLSWFENYSNHPKSTTIIKMNLEYFNISSSKRILFLLYKLREIQDSGKEVLVEWMYNEIDRDMLEVGQDFAYMARVPFEFKTYKELDLALA